MAAEAVAKAVDDPPMPPAPPATRPAPAEGTTRRKSNREVFANLTAPGKTAGGGFAAQNRRTKR